MLRSTLVLSFLFLFSALFAQNVVRVELKAVPERSAADYSIYMAGSFNGWNPQDAKYKFQKGENGNYYASVTLDNGSYEYKLTRGGWDKVECRKNGDGVENRTLVVNGNVVIEIAVEEWSDSFRQTPKVSTANKNVHIIDTALLMPQLNRKRRIWIYLPDDYAASGKRYPVLYMHDGQNVFDAATSYAGEWGVDECIDTMIKKCIVVGIDNGLEKRMNEYCPYDFSLNPAKPKELKGEGNEYVDFIVKTLKPFIDKKYRTLKDQKNTFITGSSMGGLISFFAVLKYPKIFGGAGVFSPSIWICKPEMLDLINTAGKKVKSKLYFYCGKIEGPGMVPDMLLAIDKLSAVSKSTMTTVVRDDGKHNEARWRVEFPLFYNWIFLNRN